MRVDARAQERSVILGACTVRLIYIIVACIADYLVPDYDTSGALNTDHLSGADWLVQRVASSSHMNTLTLL